MNTKEIRWTDRGLRATQRLMDLVERENLAQLLKWGIQKHTVAEWSLILNEEVGELNKELCTLSFETDANRRAAIARQARAEAVQVVTLGMKVIEMLEAEEGAGDIP